MGQGPDAVAKEPNAEATKGLAALFDGTVNRPLGSVLEAGLPRSSGALGR